MRRITIEISETIRGKPYEVIKPSISVAYDVPDGENLEDFYKKKYKEVKRIWYLHLYNMLYNTSRRHKTKSLYKFAEGLIADEEKFPTFKVKNQRRKHESH